MQCFVYIVIVKNCAKGKTTLDDDGKSNDNSRPPGSDCRQLFDEDTKLRRARYDAKLTHENTNSRHIKDSCDFPISMVYTLMSTGADILLIAYLYVHLKGKIVTVTEDQIQSAYRPDQYLLFSNNEINSVIICNQLNKVQV